MNKEELICEKCQAPLGIDEWDGWIWKCWHCDIDYRLATDAEIKVHEKEINEFYELERSKLKFRNRSAILKQRYSFKRRQVNFYNVILEKPIRKIYSSQYKLLKNKFS